MSSGTATSATLLSDAWEQKPPTPAAAPPQAGDGPAMPRPSHQLMRAQYPQMPPMQWVMPPQQRAIEPAPSVDLVGEVNNLLTNTEQYLLRQISELHRASQGHFSKALGNHLNSMQNISTPSNITSMLIALIVLVAVLILGLVFMFCNFSKKFAALRTGVGPLHQGLMDIGV
jgi:hypothetical protein